MRGMLIDKYKLVVYFRDYVSAERLSDDPVLRRPDVRGIFDCRIIIRNAQ
jgi:hypothetical protein